MSINVPKDLRNCPEGGEHRWTLATGEETPIKIDCGECGHVFANDLEDLLEMDMYPLPVLLDSTQWGHLERPVYTVEPARNP